ncbi:MAG: ABC transporter ATP-binding protein [Candidatus Polarisedimenticolia bacterium]
MREPALSMRGIHKSFGDRQAVGGLDLEVPRGCLFGLLGPNGAGKSTTIRIALDIYKPDAGEVRILGQAPSPDVASRVGYMPEERGLYTKMRVMDVLLFMAAIRGLAAREASPRVGRWLARMDLADCAAKKVQELSKGMQQKVQFIATVLHEPDLIVLDEPFSGLDPLNTQILKDIMVELRGAGRTIVFSTHVMEQAERLCDALCLISDGRKVLEGTVDSIKGSYGRNTVAVAFDGDEAQVRAHPLVASFNSYSSSMDLRLVDGADPQQLLADLVRSVRVRRFEVVEPSLHDIFIEQVAAARLRVAS